MHVVNSPGGAEEGSVQAEARAWVIRTEEDPAAAGECARWRASDPAHETAWREVLAVWDQAARLGELERPEWRAEIEALTARPSPRRWARWGLPLAASVALAVALGGLFAASRPDMRATTRLAETRNLVLADGSRVTLGAQSGLAVRFKPSARRVVLNDGEAFFEVAHLANAPFTVIAGPAEIRVTGTKFDVRKVGDDVQVSVLEGRVEVRRRKLLGALNSGPPERVLTAGYMTELAPGAATFTPEEKVKVAPGEWRSGRLYYNEAPLADIVADIQRYSAVRIRIDDPEVAKLRVTTSFRVDRLEPVLDDLETILPIRQRRAADGAIILEGRRSQTPAG